MTRFGKSPFLALTFAGCCALALLAAPASAERCAAPQLEGTWLVEVTLASPPPGFPASFTALETYSRGCGFVTSNDLGALARPGQGEWAQQGGRQFHAEIVFLNDAANGIALVTVDHTLQLVGSRRYAGAGEAEFFDAGGNSLGVASFTTTALRLRDGG